MLYCSTAQEQKACAPTVDDRAQRATSDELMMNTITIYNYRYLIISMLNAGSKIILLGKEVSK